MPAAAIDDQRQQWRTKRRNQAKGGYLFNHKALAKVFRAKLLAHIEAAGLTLPDHYPMAWVVDCKSVGTGEKALLYLGRYLYRGVIAEKDILACTASQVSFRYRNGKTMKLERRTVSGAQFLWLVLQHVLPKGFRRARNFGFLHPNCKRLIALLQVLLRCASNPGGGMGQAARPHSLRLPRCGDVDRANADSVGVFRGHATAHSSRGSALTM